MKIQSSDHLPLREAPPAGGELKLDTLPLIPQLGMKPLPQGRELKCIDYKTNLQTLLKPLPQGRELK